MFVTGRAIFRLATVRRAFREARLPTRFFRVFRTRRIWRELVTRRLLIAIWRRFCVAVPVLPKPMLSAGFDPPKKVGTARCAVRRPQRGVPTRYVPQIMLAFIGARL